MSKRYINMMTDTAIATIRANLSEVSRLMKENPTSAAWLESFVDGPLYEEKKQQIEEFSLALPSSSKDTDTIVSNAILLYEKLNHLPAHILSDERFWAWINWGIGYEAAIRMRAMSPSTVQYRWLFTHSTRRGLLRGLLSRSYFRVALSLDESAPDKYHLARFIIENPSRSQEALWRSFSCSSEIFLGTLDAEMKYKEDHPDFTERSDIFSEIAKGVSKLGSVKMLDSFSREEIAAEVYAIYEKLVSSMAGKANTAA